MTNIAGCLYIHELQLGIFDQDEISKASHEIHLHDLLGSLMRNYTLCWSEWAINSGDNWHTSLKESILNHPSNNSLASLPETIQLHPSICVKSGYGNFPETWFDPFLIHFSPLPSLISFVLIYGLAFGPYHMYHVHHSTQCSSDIKERWAGNILNQFSLTRKHICCFFSPYFKQWCTLPEWTYYHMILWICHPIFGHYGSIDTHSL